jgi:hypothetical protein
LHKRERFLSKKDFFSVVTASDIPNGNHRIVDGYDSETKTSFG